MERNVLLFGANSFIGTTLMKSTQGGYKYWPVYRLPEQGTLHFDFLEPKGLPLLVEKLKGNKYAGIIFMQGINPSVGFQDMSVGHFQDMLTLNITTPAMIVKELEANLQDNSSIVFLSSIAKWKGSYDPAYAAAKAGITGLIASLASALPRVRFNALSLGLVVDSPVYRNMTTDFRKKHTNRMYEGKGIDVLDVCRMIEEVLINKAINRADIDLTGGYR